MASQYSYGSAAASSQAVPPSSFRGNSPAAQRVQDRSGSQSPAPGSYDPALYQGRPALRSLIQRRPSASPMRAIHIADRRGAREEEYNPQNFAPVSGNSGTFHPNSARSNREEGAPPPPYSPPPSGRQPSLHVNTPHRRHASWARNGNGLSPGAPSPANSSALPTPNLMISPGPYSAASVSTANTTPLSPNDTSSPLSWFTRRRNDSPAPSRPQHQSSNSAPSAISPAPLPPRPQQQSTSVPATPPAASRDTSAHSTASSIPPPPPGPPPNEKRTARSGAQEGPVASAPTSSPPTRESGLRRAAAGVVSVFTRPKGNSNGPLSPSTKTSTSFFRTNNTEEVQREVPGPPPKRKIEDEGGSSQRQRVNPKQAPEDNTPRDSADSSRSAGSAAETNPWRNGLSERASPPRLFGHYGPPPIPEEDKEGSLLIDLASPATVKQSDLWPKSKVGTKSPKLDTRAQLPTPPPGQSVPSSPEEPAETVRGFPRRGDTEAGPSAPRDLGKGVMETEDSFLGQTRRRYKEMLNAEDAAVTDSDKLNHFLTFLTKECRKRQDMYQNGGKPEDLKKLSRIIAMLGDEPDTPVSADGDLIMTDGPAPREQRPESGWWGQTGHPFSKTLEERIEERIRDEESSRGRTSSRWWETSDGNSRSNSYAVRSDGFRDDDSLGFPHRRGGNHRYSKQPRASLKEIAELVTAPRTGPVDPNDPASFLNSAAFPPDRKQKSASRSRSRPARSRSATRPLQMSLDIAPLLTLLPTQPREYPAVNNAHPSLEVFRTLVRTLNQLDNLKTLHENFGKWWTSRQAEIAAAASRRRNSQAERIASLYASHSRQAVNPSTIEGLNLAFEDEESRHHQASLQEDLDEFSARVVDPAHRDLHERITAATAAYVDLKSIIANPPTPPTPTDTEANLDQPELLEQLTALKWLFDIRETLHTHLYDLLTERNKKYAQLILAPLQNAQIPERIQSAETFFAADEASRREQFLAARRERATEFSGFVESQVTSAVEAARSAYWDSAPLIQEALAKIPRNLLNVVPIVPPEEYTAAPELLETPVMYLERSLVQAKESVYALVERQTELLCLFHGVKTFELGVGGEQRLTEELKEQVRVIEDEWKEGLGETFRVLEERVKREVERVNAASRGDVE